MVCRLSSQFNIKGFEKTQKSKFESEFKSLFRFKPLILIVLSSFLIMPLLAAASETSKKTSHFQIERFSGKTMGTTYHIKVCMPLDNHTGVHSPSHIKTKQRLKKDIDETLKTINQSMSIYSKTSEITRFNNSKALNEKNQPLAFVISSDFHQVMRIGQQLYEMTEGTWDATLKPLIDLWGFGTKRQRTTLPSEETVTRLLSQIGFNKVMISPSNTTPHTLIKKIDAITLDLGSIAKGFGVDAIATMLKNNGYENFLVEIGGEVVAEGTKKTGRVESAGSSWMVGINRPDKGGNPNAVYMAFPLEGKGLATSGDYRNFIEIDGKTYSHIIDPKTGYPVRNGVVSTSVIAPNCTFADGLATGLMVMGPQKGIALIDTLPHVDALIVVRNENGQLSDYFSKSFPRP